MSDQAGTGSPAPDAVDPQGTDSGTDLASALKAARDDAAKNRIKAREAREAATAAEQGKSEAEARMAKMLKAAGIDSDGTDDAAAEKLLQVERTRARRAESVFVKAEFTRQALTAGVRPDRIEHAYKLADLSGVVVDLDAESADGVLEAAQAVIEYAPELAVSNNSHNSAKPLGTDARPAGRPAKGTIDLANYKQGDAMRLYRENPEEFFRIVDDGLEIPTYLPGSMQPIAMKIQRGGNAFNRQLEAIKGRRKST